MVVAATRWVLGEEIGRGALGRIVRVTEVATGRECAAKLLHASSRADPRAVERFRREARLLARLDHPNVVRVLGVEQLGDEEAILMELVEGPSLATLLARTGPLDGERLLAIGRGIADGLHAAHCAGLVHRDLKPANVLLAAGDTPKIADFGLAQTTSLLGIADRRATLVGTPDYMAPESIDPLAIDGRADLYSLGCLLYEMAAGRPPFRGATAHALLEAHAREPVPSLPPDPGRPPGLEALVRELLAKAPADRPPSAAAVRDALDALRGGHALAPRPAAPAAAGACPACGEPLAPRVRVCFGCGRPQAWLEPGPVSLFVTGPGRAADKLDAGLRQRLVDWIRGDPGLGLDPAPLARQVPRLPFLLASDLSLESARQLAASVEQLGLDCALGTGGAYSLPAMRSKAWKLSGRAALVVVSSCAGLLHSFVRFPLEGAVIAAVAVAAGVFGIGWQQAGRRATVPRPAGDPTLGPVLGEVLRALAALVPSIAARRHRESLRGVAHRVLALRAALPPEEREASDAELARAVAAAAHAAQRLDGLERELATADLREPDAAARERLHERDRLAARLLELTAFLDALRGRHAALGAGRARLAADEALADLRAQVEALEEVCGP